MPIYKIKRIGRQLWLDRDDEWRASFTDAVTFRYNELPSHVPVASSHGGRAAPRAMRQPYSKVWINSNGEVIATAVHVGG